MSALRIAALAFSCVSLLFVVGCMVYVTRTNRATYAALAATYAALARRAEEEARRRDQADAVQQSTRNRVSR